MKTFELLNKGDKTIVDIYKEAHMMWGQILSKDWNTTELSDVLGDAQLNFESQLGKFGLDRWEGQEIFVISGLTYFTNEIESKNKKAYKISLAFEMSWCSIEVKSLAKRLSKAFYLGEF
ncbi:hypothetical protein ACR90R_14440 [Klebsiella pneumoniae]|uniref:hypothetical protein n=1 Tax=Klebsiella TaxID=570 RepID=UPI0010839F27|nr:MULTISPECIES: hypothetical protein [Klebsiella]MCJ4882044.1 hypothetical protein [Klebsiella quasipneumoniae]VGE57508.1 Uncharacterised protein [Klebsiella quasipneumoniae]HBR5657197.1 hypothetical protein [Klebsiella pneumoniae]HCB0454099.1 hypothetical protein [Klebsiella quasipneumoniae subsp. quasipneumoniae]